jgi:hypothetical protein
MAASCQQLRPASSRHARHRHSPSPPSSRGSIRYLLSQHSIVHEVLRYSIVRGGAFSVAALVVAGCFKIHTFTGAFESRAGVSYRITSRLPYHAALCTPVCPALFAASNRTPLRAK